MGNGNQQQDPLESYGAGRIYGKDESADQPADTPDGGVWEVGGCPNPPHFCPRGAPFGLACQRWQSLSTHNTSSIRNNGPKTLSPIDRMYIST
jgi:hypothetical protein